MAASLWFLSAFNLLNHEMEHPLPLSQCFFYIFFQILFSLDLFFQEQDLCLELLLQVICCCPHTDDVFPVLQDQLTELLDQGLAEMCILLSHSPRTKLCCPRVCPSIPPPASSKVLQSQLAWPQEMKTQQDSHPHTFLMLPLPLSPTKAFRLKGRERP